MRTLAEGQRKYDGCDNRGSHKQATDSGSEDETHPAAGPKQVVRNKNRPREVHKNIEFEGRADTLRPSVGSHPARQEKTKRECEEQSGMLRLS